MKSDLTHEQLRSPFYDNALLVSFVFCVPLAFVLNVISKLRRANIASLNETEYGVRTDKRRSNQTGSSAGLIVLPQKEFRRYTLGLASMSDRLAIRAYFQAMLSSRQCFDSDDDSVHIADSQRNRRVAAPIEFMLDKLGYPACEHPQILKDLTQEHPRRGIKVGASRCCASWHRKPDPNSMQIYIEQAEGPMIKLSLENNCPWTIQQLKEKILEEREGTGCCQCSDAGDDADSLDLLRDGRRLHDNQTVTECGIEAGDRLQLNENGITFKKLSRYHNAKLGQLQPANTGSHNTSSRYDEPWQQLQTVQHVAQDVGSGGVEEPLMRAAASVTRPASPATSKSPTAVAAGLE